MLIRFSLMPSKVADALKSETYESEQAIVTEGEAGDKFYIVEAGSPVAVKGGEVVMTYLLLTYMNSCSLMFFIFIYFPHH